jgi:hypothetical protein
VLLLELDEFDPDDPRPPCVDCIGEGRCSPAAIQCRCGASVPPRTVALNRQLDGLRFSALDPSTSYCILLAAYDIPGAPPVDPPPADDCACDFGGVDLTGTVRLCGISPFAANVGENEPFAPIPVDCSTTACLPLERL